MGTSPYELDLNWLWDKEAWGRVATLRCIVEHETSGRVEAAVEGFLDSLPADGAGVRGRGGWAAYPVEGLCAVDLVSGGEDVADGIQAAAEAAHEWFAGIEGIRLRWKQRPRRLRIEAVQGDITQQRVDAVVNAANTRMRGGGGVDGAMHRAGGPAILEDCIERFPVGLETGDAGWTTAGDLPARWVIHTVGPDRRAGQTDRRLLESCYRRSLEVAAELGAQTVAFPLISAGIFGWPKDDAIACAIDTIVAVDPPLERVLIVAFDVDTYRQVVDALHARELGS